MEDEPFTAVYSQDELLGFQQVGEFLCWFSMLETNINESIVNLLGLEPDAGRLLMSYIPFGRKCEFFWELIELEDVGFREEEKKAAHRKLAKIRRNSARRNIIAHAYFRVERGPVMTANKKFSEEFSKALMEREFLQCRAEMADLWGWVAFFTQQIRQKMDENAITKAMVERTMKENIDPFARHH